MSLGKKRKPFGRRLLASLEQGLEALRSGHELPTTVVMIPPDPAPFKSADLVELRKRYQITQQVLAEFLNVSDKAVESWEQGTRKPNGAALRLLQLLDKPSLFMELVGPSRSMQPAAKIGEKIETYETAAQKHNMQPRPMRMAVKKAHKINTK
jgi:putative transcriptional regulator